MYKDPTYQNRTSTPSLVVYTRAQLLLEDYQYDFVPVAGPGSTSFSADPNVSLSTSDAGATGFVNGTGSAVRFDHPCGLVFNEAGNLLYICDWGNHAIRTLNTRTGTVGTLTVGSEGGTLQWPMFITRGPLSGDLYVSCAGINEYQYPYGGGCIVKVDAITGEQTFLAFAHQPRGITCDPTESFLYFMEQGHYGHDPAQPSTLVYIRGGFGVTGVAGGVVAHIPVHPTDPERDGDLGFWDHPSALVTTPDGQMWGTLEAPIQSFTADFLLPAGFYILSPVNGIGLQQGTMTHLSAGNMENILDAAITTPPPGWGFLDQNQDPVTSTGGWELLATRGNGVERYSIPHPSPAAGTLTGPAIGFSWFGYSDSGGIHLRNINPFGIAGPSEEGAFYVTGTDMQYASPFVFGQPYWDWGDRCFNAVYVVQTKLGGTFQPWLRKRQRDDAHRAFASTTAFPTSRQANFRKGRSNTYW